MQETFNVYISPQLKSVLKARNMTLSVASGEEGLPILSWKSSFSIAVLIAYADKKLDRQKEYLLL